MYIHESKVDLIISYSLLPSCKIAAKIIIQDLMDDGDKELGISNQEFEGSFRSIPVKGRIPKS